MFLNLLDVHDIPFHSSHGHLVTLTERNSFQQHITVYSLQTATKEDKVGPAICMYGGGGGGMQTGGGTHPLETRTL